MYRPWLEKAAENLQKLIAARPLPSAGTAAQIRVEPGVCIVFADGLRMDLGQRLAEELADRGLGVTVDWRWSTVPTVTATAKPAASPIGGALDSASRSDDFVPSIRETSKNLTSERFRALLKGAGVEPLTADQGGSGSSDASAWLEVGTIDHRGHGEGVRLAAVLEDEVRSIAERVVNLLAAGWMRVRIVTDHGWLLLPGGLPKVSLPRYLTETRWGRCASVKDGASPDCLQHAWHWNSTVSIALAPGISCFREGTEYAHGGLSLQESVIPVLTVSAAAGSGGEGRAVTITELVWNQLTGRVQVGGSGGVLVDLRRDAADSASTLLDSERPRPIDARGQAKIYARDDAEGADAEVVVLDADGNILARRRTRVGLE